eukprot:g6507.t1
MLRLLLFLLAAASADGSSSIAMNQRVSEQVGARVSHAISRFLAVPEEINKNFVAYRGSSRGFAKGATANDLADLDKYFFSQMLGFNEGFTAAGSTTKTHYVDMIYFGTETGAFTGWGRGWHTYRPPGADVDAPWDGTNSRYTSANPYLDSCVGSAEGLTSASRQSLAAQCVTTDPVSYVCDMSTGAPAAFSGTAQPGAFVACADLPGAADLTGGTLGTARDPDAMCLDYSICTFASGGGTNPAGLGHTPRHYYCHDTQGRVSENDVTDFASIPGHATYGINTNTNNYPGSTNGNAKANSMNDGMGACAWHKMNVTTANEALDTTMCHRGTEAMSSTPWGMVSALDMGDTATTTTYYGAYRSRAYDPRYRSWYTATRLEQRSTYSSIYTMATSGQLGFTATSPAYSYCDKIPGFTGAAGAATGAATCKPYDDIEAMEVAAPQLQLTCTAATAAGGGAGGRFQMTSAAATHGLSVGQRVMLASSSAATTATTTATTTAACTVSWTAHTVATVVDARTFTVDSAHGFSAQQTVTGKLARAKVLAGVAGVDYILESFNLFLQESFGGEGEDKYVFVEERATKELVANSLNVGLLHANASRVKVTDLSLNTTADAAIFVASWKLVETSYSSDNTNRMIRIELANKTKPARDDGTFNYAPYYVQSFTFTKPGIDWRVVVVSPGTKATDDFVKPASPMGAIAIVVGVIGCLLSLYFFVYVLIHRTMSHIRIGDWRFLGLFCFGSVLCNLSIFTLLGPQNIEQLGSWRHDVLCGVRVWTLNLFFTFTFSALFWKVFRMWRLLDNPKLRRVVISNRSLFLKLGGTVAIEVLILLLWQIIDPVKARVNPKLGADESPPDFVDHVYCADMHGVFGWVEVGWKAILILFGVFLAVKTRNVEAKYAESKGL